MTTPQRRHHNPFFFFRDFSQRGGGFVYLISFSPLEAEKLLSTHIDIAIRLILPPLILLVLLLVLLYY